MKLKKASLSVEAAIVIPFVILAIILVSYFLVIINIQVSLQDSIDEALNKFSNKSYTIEKLEEIISKDEDGLLSKASKVGENIYLYEFLKNEIITEDLKKKLKNTLVMDKHKGISFIGSSYDNKTSEINIVMTYQVTLPFIADNIIELKFIQKAAGKGFLGTSIKDIEKTYEDMVYLTKSGKVYHTNKYCSYLLRYEFVTTYDKVEGLGGFNSFCEFCAKGTLEKSEYVIVTTYGKVLHNDFDCTRLHRDVFMVKLSSCENMQLCELCKKKN